MDTTEVLLLGTFVLALGGTLVAAQKRLDLYGVIFVTCISALGGGTARDILIGHYPLSWVQDIRYVIAVITAIFFALAFRRFLKRISNALFIVDSIGSAIFTISSVQHCLDLEVHPAIAVVLGMFSVTIGSVLRDVLCNDVPGILRRELNASAAIVGGVAYLGIHQVPWFGAMQVILPMILIVGLRIAARKYRLSLPIITEKPFKKARISFKKS